MLEQLIKMYNKNSLKITGNVTITVNTLIYDYFEMLHTEDVWYSNNLHQKWDKIIPN